jgi:hypothetical protein
MRTPREFVAVHRGHSQVGEQQIDVGSTTITRLDRIATLPLV